MKPRRILMTVDAVGGVWRYACELSAALRPLGVETVLAVLGPSPTQAQRDELDDGVALVETDLVLDWLAADAARVEEAGLAVASLAERLDVDLVHLNQPALAASATFAMPIVTAIHSCVATWWEAVHGGEAPASFAWQTALVSRGLRRSDVVVAPTSAFAQAVRRTYLLEATPFVIANGRSPPLPGLVPRHFDIFTAGRLWDEGKNIAILDRAAARLAGTVHAAGAVRSPRGDRVELHHIEALGALDAASVAACLASRPVYVAPARYEPFGLAVLEAASAGCALVLADIPTFRETWEGAAIFVAPSDEDGLLAAIETLVEDADLRELRGERARERAARFTPEQMAAGMHLNYVRALVGCDAAAEAVAP